MGDATGRLSLWEMGKEGEGSYGWSVDFIGSPVQQAILLKLLREEKDERDRRAKKFLKTRK